jgi:hypothetical protein
MAIPWITLLKTVPWTQVIANAPAVANGARKLWNSVAGGSEPPPPSAAPDPAPPVTTDNAGLAALQQEVARLQAASDALHQQMRASSQLIQELADQNTALIERIETYRFRIAWLTWGFALMLVATLAAWFLVLMG